MSLPPEQLLKRYGVALTGGVATGKSHVAKLLRDRGYVVIDADALARSVVEPGRPALAAIAARFGRDVLKDDGTLDRRKLREIMQANPAARKDLEKITHPAIRAELFSELETSGLVDRPRIFFYEAALIFETDRAHEFRAVWSAYAEPVVQQQRLMQRDRVSAESAAQLIASQMPATEKARRADAVIRTDLGDEQLAADLAGALASSDTHPT